MCFFTFTYLYLHIYIYINDICVFFILKMYIYIYIFIYIYIYIGFVGETNNTASVFEGLQLFWKVLSAIPGPQTARTTWGTSYRSNSLLGCFNQPAIC